MKERDVIVVYLKDAQGELKLRPTVCLRQLPDNYHAFIVCGLTTRLQYCQDLRSPFSLARFPNLAWGILRPISWEKCVIPDCVEGFEEIVPPQDDDLGRLKETSLIRLVRTYAAPSRWRGFLTSPGASYVPFHGKNA